MTYFNLHSSILYVFYLRISTPYCTNIMAPVIIDVDGAQRVAFRLPHYLVHQKQFCSFLCQPISPIIS